MFLFNFGFIDKVSLIIILFFNLYFSFKNKYIKHILKQFFCIQDENVEHRTFL